MRVTTFVRGPISVMRGLRRCNVLVNDKPLMKNGSHNGELKRLYIWVTKGHCTTRSVQIKA